MSDLSLKYEENIKKAIKELRIADHILYVTYPVIKDKRLLLKALEQIFEANIAVINAILQYDYLWKKIQLTEGGKKNLEIFIHECSKRYNITAQETSEIQEIISLMEMHKKSPIEFQRKEKVVIVSDDLKTSNLDSEKLKKYLNSTKAIIEKARICMSLKRI